MSPSLRGMQLRIPTIRSGGAFTPLSVADSYWYDPTTGLFQDAALTTAAGNGNPVGGWVERRAAVANGTAATTARPTLNTSAFGVGLPGLSFDGNDSLDVSALATHLTGEDKPFSVVMAAKLTNTATFYVLFGGGNSASATSQIYHGSINTAKWRALRRSDAGGLVYVDSTDASDTSTHVITLVFTGTTVTMRVDGVAVHNGASLNTGTITVDRVAISGQPTSGTSVNFPWNGLIGDVIFVPRVIDAGEIAQLESFVAPRCGLTYPFDFALTSPVPLQVFQRSGSTGDIVIAGTIKPAGAHDVEARFKGGAWQTVATGETGAFTATLSGQAQGQGAFEIRLADTPASITTIADVGIGDVYICAGQSNMSGRGTNNQTYDYTGLRATLFANNYQWRELADPYDSATGQIDTVSSDTSPAAAGSFVPLLATLVMDGQSVPVAFVPCAKGGTSITSWLPGVDHEDRTTPYGSMVYRALQTGARAVLWWLGETDALAAMTQATYNGHLDTIADAIQADLGVPTVPCKLQSCTGIPDVDEAAINAAIGEAWADNANVLEGPDLSDITSDDGFHIMTDAKLETVAARWWAALEATVYA